MKSFKLAFLYRGYRQSGQNVNNKAIADDRDARSSFHAQDMGWQSGLRSCIMPARLVQELNVGTVHCMSTK